MSKDNVIKLFSMHLTDTMLVIIYPKIQELSVRISLVGQLCHYGKENCQNKRNVLKGGPKFPNRVSEWKCAYHLQFFAAILEFRAD